MLFWLAPRRSSSSPAVGISLGAFVGYGVGRWWGFAASVVWVLFLAGVSPSPALGFSGRGLVESLRGVQVC
ncbi:hypothetical protein P8452_01209 [Trifolium repens]|nr:hypothetical protein P8452_01209 [Trifolium repens]